MKGQDAVLYIMGLIMIMLTLVFFMQLFSAGK